MAANSATLTYSGGTDTDTACVSVTIPVIELAVDKSLLGITEVDKNDFQATFSLHVTNGGETLVNAELDDLMSAASWTAATSSAVVSDVQLISEDTASTWTTTVTASGDNIATAVSWPAGDSATFYVTVDFTVDTIANLPICQSQTQQRSRVPTPTVTAIAQAIRLISMSPASSAIFPLRLIKK